MKAKPPEWFTIGEKLIWTGPNRVFSRFDNEKVGTLNQQNALRCAAIHFLHCLGHSIQTNKQGQHAVSVSLIRQCVESLAVMELGLLKDVMLGLQLLDDWLEGKRTAGGIRKELEGNVWQNYGRGLWTETWAEFYGNFCKAVQPYAHYSSELQSWQMAILADSARKKPDGGWILISQVGLQTYDPNKATRITLFHMLLSWVLARIAAANGFEAIDNSTLVPLGEALANSEELWRSRVDWHVQFWAHEFNASAATE